MVREQKNIEKPKKVFYSIKALLQISLSIIFFLSFFSFLFQWDSDQSHIQDLFNREIVVKNMLGKLGAKLGHSLMYKGIGVAIFFLPILFLLSAIKTLFETKRIKLQKVIFHGLFFSFWLPPTLSFIFYKLPLLGGVFGFEIKLIFINLIGEVGLAILLSTSILLYFIIVFRISSEKIKKGLFYSFSFLRKKKTTPLKILDSSPIELKNNVKKELNPNLNHSDKSIETINEPSFIKLTLEKNPINLNQENLKSIKKENAKKNFPIPSLDLLEFQDPSKEISIDKKELETNKNKIVETLNHYKIGIEKIKATVGSTITLYEIIPEAGIRISRIKNLEDDIALSLAALGIRIIAPIPGKGTIGIEVPNSKPSMVYMKGVLASEQFTHTKMDLPIILGKTISNETFLVDMTKMPHLLMAGATGQGKSVGLNVIITSLLYKKAPQELKFVMIDPKKVELSLYKKIEKYYMAKLPHLKESIITDTSQARDVLNSLCKEMDRRYDLLKGALVRNIKEYNEKFIENKELLPYIILVVDEFADLIMTAGREIEVYIARLAQLARAVGIHLIIATQRPSVNVITGLIKANFPARIAFRVSSKVDSRTILDSTGAEQLIGRGDMLFSNGGDLIRLQCPFISTREIENVLNFYEGEPSYMDLDLFKLPEPDRNKESDKSDTSSNGTFDIDPLFEEAAKIVIINQQGSTSIIQRKLSIGYNRAARIVDQLEANGIVGPFEGSKSRQVLYKTIDELNKLFEEKNTI